MAHTEKLEVNLSLEIPKIQTNNQLNISEMAMKKYCFVHGIEFKDTFDFKHSLRSTMIREFADRQ